MLDAELRFAEAFIQAYPGDAADVLELQTADINADLLQRLSPELTAGMLSAMLPLHAARLLGALEPKAAARQLAALKANQIATILRYLSPLVAERYLKRLPFDLSTACRLLLGYSTNMVGAWMIPHVMMLATDCSVGEALQRIPQQGDRVDTDAIYVVNRELVPQGVLSVFNLLQAGNEIPLARLMDRNTYAISGRASLASVQRHEGWNHRDTLPVLNHRRQLIGMLRHVDLRKGLERLVGGNSNTAAAVPVTDLYQTYGRVLMALFNVVNDVTGKK